MVESGGHIVSWDLVDGSLWQFMIIRQAYFKLQSLVGICLHENTVKTSLHSNEPVVERQRRDVIKL